MKTSSVSLFLRFGQDTTRVILALFLSFGVAIPVVHGWTRQSLSLPTKKHWMNYNPMKLFDALSSNTLCERSIHSNQHLLLLSRDDTIQKSPSSSNSSSQLLPQVKLRNATIDDLDVLLFWDDKEHLQDCGGDQESNDWNWQCELPRMDISWRYQLIAEDCRENNKPIAFVQIIHPLEEESHYWGTDYEPNLRAIDIWIGDESYLNRGYGTQIMNQVLAGAFVFGNPYVTAALIDPMASNIAAHRFYQRLGFVPIGTRYFGTDRCLVHRLNRTDYFSKRSKYLNETNDKQSSS
jgi:aminoglycoside 6'-N-acetyltransferase